MLKPSKIMHRAMNSCFSQFKNKLKNRYTNCSPKSSKIEQVEPSERHGSRFLVLGSLLGRLKKSKFFDVVLGLVRITKNRTLEGPKSAGGAAVGQGQKIIWAGPKIIWRRAED